MARPKKAPEDQRNRVLSVRLTAEEYARVEDMARAAGMLAGPYARTTILGKRPRSKPVTNLVFEKLIYELQSIATNFRQLHDATGEERFLKMARYVGGHMVERLLGRNDLISLIEEQLEPLNGAGHAINGLARKANSGSDIEAEERTFAIQSIKLALKPLEDALSGGKG
ncbi:plasmid mobilization protein [Kordiimonas sp.]|uniref:plasmid mobilization protein n=1 Tax=Kordiimonas sp. TaxID=1970157 RepID=UPI003B51AF04